MKPFKTNSLSRRDQNRRLGITMIEVLTSILVALIGVFGVLVMVPFGVSQAEQGLRQDEATGLAMNAINDFKNRDFGNTERWHTVAGVQLTNLDPLARAYVIDPIGVADRLRASQDGTGRIPPLVSGVFPFTSSDVESILTGPGGVPSEQNVVMSRVTLDVNSSIMPREVADRLFSWGSDLVVEEETDDNLPPLQIFDVDAGDNPVRRQALRDMSYIVVAVPAKVSPGPGGDRVFAWRNYFVVYEKRPQPLEFLGQTPEPGETEEHPYDRVFRVTNPGGANLVSYSGGDVVLTELNQNSTQSDEIQRGDWIMLTNVAFSAALQRYTQQVHFYKVVDSENSAGSWEVTLQGPNFDFRSDTDTNSGAAADPPDPMPSTTYAIHLPNVWAVFERTFR